MKFRQSKFICTNLFFLGALFASVVNCFALDREAFTFTKYYLTIQIEPEQHRLGIRGKITLQNNTSAPQKIAVLQISSSLDWRSIKANDQPVQFLTQPLTSDIDHTGGLSEAIVTLPRAVTPKGTIELEIGYEGVVLADATRLTRIGTPEDVAKNTDWDQIAPDFTAVRGAGYVAWYPIATEVANLSEGNSLSEVLARWKAREAESAMSLLFESTQRSTILFSGFPEPATGVVDKGMVQIGAFSILRLSNTVPTFVLADYKKIDVPSVSTISFFPGKEASAASYAELLGSLNPLPGASRAANLQMAQLPNSEAASFLSDNLLLMPFQPLTDEVRLGLVYALARQSASSPRPWICEGLAHLAQVLDIEERQGRKAALDYLNAHSASLIETEKQVETDPSTNLTMASSADRNSLINTNDALYLQSKAMWVWWMLHEILGSSFGMVLSSYQFSADKDPSYMPRLIASHTQRDLNWFFEDWVYRDRGLPDFKVDSAFSRETPTKSFLVAVTVSNLGGAGAEVPVIVKFKGGEVMKRLEVRAKDKVTIRIEVPAQPDEIVVNDGSVPESDTTNNVFKIQATGS